MPAHKVSFAFETSRELAEDEIAEAKIALARFIDEFGLRFGESPSDALRELPVRWTQE